MHAVDLVIGIGWAVFWIGWLVAGLTAKRSRGRWGRFPVSRVALAVVAVLVIRLNWRGGGGPGSGPHVGPVLAGIGLALWLAGVALAVWARLYIGRNWGMPMTKRAQPDLVTTGPYRFVRHPIYSGIILALAGSALAVTLWLLIAVAAVVGFFAFSAYREEGFLGQEFPDAYPAYRARTKMLIPFVF